MKQWTKLLALLLALCMFAAMFAGCAAKESTPASETSEAAPSETSESAADNAYDAADTILLPVLTNLNTDLGKSVMCAADLAKQEIEAAGGFTAAEVQAALADTSKTYECASGTFSFDETGTPIKSGVLMGYSYDEASGSVVKNAIQTLSVN